MSVIEMTYCMPTSVYRNMRPDFDAEKSPLITNAGENLVIYHAG